MFDTTTQYTTGTYVDTAAGNIDHLYRLGSDTTGTVWYADIIPVSNNTYSFLWRQVFSYNIISYTIVHYRMNDGVVQSKYMIPDPSHSTFQLFVPMEYVGSNITYSYTYNSNGIQFDTQQYILYNWSTIHPCI